MRVWDSIKDAHDTGNTVQGRLMRRIKGGIVVDLFGVDAFLPGSQIDIRQVKNFDQFLGQEFPFKIICPPCPPSPPSGPPFAVVLLL